MTPKQVLDSFSASLLQDDRILSAREQALLLGILQHARSAANGNSETHTAVESVVASAVGEAVAQRAFSILGSSIVERILTSAPLATPDTGSRQSVITHTMGSPNLPQPQPPHIRKPTPPEPQPPSKSQPQPPSKAQPQPPHRASLPDHHTLETDPEHRVAVLERPEVARASCVVLDEFLSPQELEELTQFTLQHEIDFSASEVVSPTNDDGVINYEHRRSRVLMDPGIHQEILLERVKSALPQVLEKLGLEEFPITSMEAQITASNDGDFFHNHNDNGEGPVASRYLTFVYFFHHEPRRFEGGELRIHDSRREGDHHVAAGSYQTIAPQQNQIVFFPSSLLHEITTVKCPSGLFADSRFTLNGWLHR